MSDVGLETRGRPVGPGSFHSVLLAELRHTQREALDRLFFGQPSEARVAEIITEEIELMFDRLDVALLFAEPGEEDRFARLVSRPATNAYAMLRAGWHDIGPRIEVAALDVVARLNAANWLESGHEWVYDAHA